MASYHPHSDPQVGKLEARKDLHRQHRWRSDITGANGWAVFRRCHSAPPVAFPALPGRCEGSYQGSGAAAVCSSTVAIHALTRPMTAHCWLQLRASFTKPLHPCSHTDGEIQGRTKPHKKHRSTPPPPQTQTHSSTISSQRDCTHSNKHRRRLLSESNYLVLSISMSAGGQQALCWWG